MKQLLSSKSELLKINVYDRHVSRKMKQKKFYDLTSSVAVVLKEICSI
jgi:hypothetical protein